MASVSLRNIKKIYPMIATEGRRRQQKKQSADKENHANLQVTDQGVVAVQDFTLDIADKEFIVLVGPSGCGKSTTLRMIAGLEEITQGELYIGNRLVNNVEPKDRDIAMVFQNYALYPHMTVYENLAFALKQKKIPKAEIQRRVQEAADILDINEYLDRKPRNLSGGQRQRVAIGRAIVRDPQVFLMDEPLSNLDAKLRNQMRAEIIKLRKRIDTTFVYVTHDQTEAMTLGDRIVIMKDGFIQQIGTPQQVFDHPANQFVAGFIGSPQMNFFPATLHPTRDGYSVELANARVTLPAEKAANLSAAGCGEQKIILGLRPEHLTLCRSTDSGGIPAVVDVYELMGSVIHLHVETADQSAVILAQAMDGQGHLQMDFTSGSAVWYTFPGYAAHLFDPASGKNLEQQNPL